MKALGEALITLNVAVLVALFTVAAVRGYTLTETLRIIGTVWAHPVRSFRGHDGR